MKTEMFCNGILMAAENILEEGSYRIDITNGYLTIEKDQKAITFSKPTVGNENPMSEGYKKKM